MSGNSRNQFIPLSDELSDFAPGAVIYIEGDVDVDDDKCAELLADNTESATSVAMAGDSGIADRASVASVVVDVKDGLVDGVVVVDVDVDVVVTVVDVDVVVVVVVVVVAVVVVEIKL
jgi:hypothetical protein